MSAPLSYATVCSGIGAPEEAVTPLGWRCCWQAETNSQSSRVLAARHPAPNLEDMTGIAARVLEQQTNG